MLVLPPNQMICKRYWPAELVKLTTGGQVWSFHKTLDIQLLPHEVATSSCWASSQFTKIHSLWFKELALLTFFCHAFLEKQESLVHRGSGPEAHSRPAESEQCHLLPHCPELLGHASPLLQPARHVMTYQVQMARQTRQACTAQGGAGRQTKRKGTKRNP